MAITLLCAYGYFFYLGGNWNIESRNAQIWALAERGTLVVDGYPFLPPGGGDAALFQGRYYSDKLIGPSLVAVPVYRAARELATTAGMPARPAVYLALRVANLATNAGPAALLGGLLYLFLAGLGTSAAMRLWVALSYGLGTLAFPYSTALFGHQLAAVCVAAAFMLLWRQQEGWSHRRAAAAGGLVGLAAISDVMGLFIAPILGLYALHLSRRGVGGEPAPAARGLGRAAPFAAIALAVFSLQLAANWWSFGGPLIFPHIHHAQAAFRARHTAGLFGIHTPQLYPLYQLTIGPWRGLFYGSPVLLLALPGLILLGRERRAEALTIAGSWLAVLLIHSGYENWTAGSAYGPRYQIVVIPMLMIAAAPAAARWPWAFKALAVVSIALTAIVTAQSPFVPEDLRNPLAAALAQFGAGNLLHGNLGAALGLPGLTSLLPLAAMVAACLLALRRAAEHAGQTRRTRAC